MHRLRRIARFSDRSSGDSNRVGETRRAATAWRIGNVGSLGGERESAGALALGLGALILAMAAIALGACGDDDDAGGDVTLAELRSQLPAADDLGL
jgi:hypothetical protein